jgi:selenophosphate synthase
VTGGLGSFDGRAGALADNNQVTAKVNNNIVDASDASGLGIFGATFGLANTNQVSAEVGKNQVCNSGTTDIQVYGGFPGNAFFPPTSGVNNVAQVQTTKNTATTIAASNGVAGNFAVLTQSKNVPCP